MGTTADEYDYGADTVRIADLLDRRAQHNYYRYENEVDDYRQDHYQLHLDQNLGEWDLGGVFYATLGCGFLRAVPSRRRPCPITDCLL